MEAYFLDWINLLLRWLHVITAIAWVGSSFYFVFLDNNLLRPSAPDLLEKGVDGAMWAVHGGGFYNPQKYMVAPKNIDSKLHWFYWESYSTWLSGFALFTVTYLWNASTYLIDKSLMDWSPTIAVVVALCFLIGFWTVYDAVSRLFGFRKNGELIVAGVMLCVVAFAAWLACQWFAGRAAFLLIGAMIATAMSANVFVWIIPGQRKVVAAMTSGEKYDAASLAIHGMRGKQRSVHNTYFTLPVILSMLSTHYSFLYTHSHRWLILFTMMFAGALIRQFFVQRHGYLLGRTFNPWPFAAVGVILILTVILAMAPWGAKSEASQVSIASPAPTYNQVQAVIAQRCVTCHGAQVQMKNVRLDSAEGLQSNAQNVYLQVSVTRQMPMNNATGITEDERVLIARWVQAGAKID
jgi:uncharacterized membrane protein